MNSISPKGWCPTIHAPMVAGDGLLVRVHPPGSALAAPAARLLASAAAQYGNGIIDLGSRASLQVRGLRQHTAAPFAAAMVAAGLAHPDPDIERRRRVIAPPLAGDDPSGASADSVVRAIEEMRSREASFACLHPKFGVLVDAGGVLPIGAANADIRVLLAGGVASVLLDGSDLACIVDPPAVAETTRRLTLALLAMEFPAPRMRSLVSRVGAARLFAAAGLVPTKSVALPPVPTALGWLPYQGSLSGALAVGLPFGVTDAATLAALADVAERYADGSLRLTPWRALVIRGVTEPEALESATARLRVIIRPDHPLAQIAACTGEPGCASATVPARRDALRLVASGVAGDLHVSGCAKGCAHPSSAAITLVGEAGRYALVRNGRAADTPVRNGMTIQDAIETLLHDQQGVAA